MLACTMASDRAPGPPHPLKVMSFNVRYGVAEDGPDHWEFRRTRMEAFLNRHPAHLIGMQETLHFQVEEIRRMLGGWNALGGGREDGDWQGEISAILYDPSRLAAIESETFWFSDTPDVPGSRHWGNEVIRVCTWALFRDLDSGLMLYHFNTHLDHVSQPSRERSAELLVERIRKRRIDAPVVVTGDFNVGETNRVVDILREAGFRDSFRVLHPNTRDVGTFSAFQDRFDPDKIDYLFVDGRAEVLEASIVRERVEGRWPSDHAPVTATLRFHS
jgi:endonuclease/exonuclease/phosphatase family metal-dependent hydrolase